MFYFFLRLLQDKFDGWYNLFEYKAFELYWKMYDMEIGWLRRELENVINTYPHGSLFRLSFLTFYEYSVYFIIYTGSNINTIDKNNDGLSIRMR